MKYVRADEIFPSELLCEMQKYITDGLIYIPKPKQSRKRWGEASGERQRLECRNKEIKESYKKAKVSLDTLAAKHGLSVETVKNIVYRK